MEQSIDFCTLGMFIIDEIHFQPPTPPVKNILGGAGSYSALGARIFSPPPISKSVGWIVDRGSDFPSELLDVIASWGTTCLIRETPDRLTTRGWNGYGENEHRAFKYMTPKLRLDHSSLNDQLLMSKSFHLICSSSRCEDLNKQILERRKHLPGLDASATPLMLWEPVPDMCTPEELERCYEALKHVNVVSPNHQELCSFFGKSGNLRGDVDHRAVVECCNDWLKAGLGANGAGGIVVRCGKDGCYVATRERSRWLPAYHTTPERVVDPTGGGNTFLGGLAVGLVRIKAATLFERLVKASVWASVAASLAIEQVGIPKLASSSEGEIWNGVRVEDRLLEYRNRLSTYVQP